MTIYTNVNRPHYSMRKLAYDIHNLGSILSIWTDLNMFFFQLSINVWNQMFDQHMCSDIWKVSSVGIHIQPGFYPNVDGFALTDKAMLFKFQYPININRFMVTGSVYSLRNEEKSLNWRKGTTIHIRSWNHGREYKVDKTMHDVHNKASLPSTVWALSGILLIIPALWSNAFFDQQSSKEHSPHLAKETGVYSKLH